MSKDNQGDETTRRYNAAGPALKAIFGGPVRRIALDAGFTCPTRDGSLGSSGCLYCDADGSRAAYVKPHLPVREQLQRGIARASSKPQTRFVAYLQAYTNTYADENRLREVYSDALSDPRVAGMAIGTRPDCLREPVLDLLEEFSQKTFLWLEVGLQSSRDETLRHIGRGHTVADFLNAARNLRQRQLRFCGHVIFGLPGDKPEDMLASAQLLNQAGAWGAKIHNLYIDTRSPLSEAYLRGEVPMLERAEYMELVIEFLCRLSPETLVHRLIGETPKDRLLAPAWSADKQAFLRDLDREMERLGMMQGCKRIP